MKWAGALSTEPSLEGAIAEVVAIAQQRLAGARADVGFVFVSSAFASEYGRVMPLLSAKLPGVPLIGCGGGGVVGMGDRPHEIEDDVAISLTLAVLPEVAVHCFHVETDALPDLDGAPQPWLDLVGVSSEVKPQFVVLIDPMSEGMNDFLSGLDYAYPGLPKVGGLSNGGLFCNGQFHKAGAVGVALSGNVAMDPIVAQGCRPVGNPFWVTESERNVILQMRAEGDNDGKESPLELLRSVVESLPDEVQELARQAMFVGVAQNAFKTALEPGDFLVRNLLGFDPRVGALAIGDRIRQGQRIQFHLRDASAAADELEMLVERYRDRDLKPQPEGVLMFSCLGRGESLYGEADFDSGILAEYFPLPMGGFFCNGEIGPVGDNTFMHGYTVVFGMFRPLW
jgi:small ligand-binding sensory domain FIST